MAKVIDRLEYFTRNAISFGSFQRKPDNEKSIASNPVVRRIVRCDRRTRLPIATTPVASRSAIGAD
jgi:hypothetical protein